MLFDLIFEQSLSMDAPLAEGSQPHPKELFIEEIMSSEESANRYQVDFKFAPQMEADEWNNASSYGIGVRKVNDKGEWEVSRKYEDFEWLFKALKRRFPGVPLPYFPSLSIQHYLTAKAESLSLKINRQLFAPRPRELARFLRGVCSHRQLGGCQQLEVFLLADAEFERKKGQMAREAEEARLTSKSFSIYSFITSTLSWLARSKEVKPPLSNDLVRIQFYLDKYSSQITFLLLKFGDFAHLKREEAGWGEAESEIDSLEMVKARMVTSKAYNERLAEEIENGMVLRLVEELKREGQLEEQVGERIEVGKLIQYLRSTEDSDERIRYLEGQVSQFDHRMLQEWPRYQMQWRDTVGEIDAAFRRAWSEYCEKMGKIWR